MRKLQDQQVRTEFGKYQNMQNNNKTYFEIAKLAMPILNSTKGHFGIGDFENEKFGNQPQVPLSLLNYHAVGISNLRCRLLKNSKFS